MGCPWGTRSVFTRAFRAKRELQCIFLWIPAIVITSKHGTIIFFSHYNLFLGRLKEKLARKARVNTDASMWIVLMPPRHPIILITSKFNMAAVSVKRSIVLRNSRNFATHHWFLREMTFEKRVHKFHTDNASLPRSG